MSAARTYGNNPNGSRKRSTVASLLYVESSLVFALGVWLAVLGLTHKEKEMSPLIGVIVFALLGAAGLFASARGYLAGKNFGRAPAVLANLIALGVAYYQIQGHFYGGALVILALALPTLYNAIAISIEENSPAK